MSDWGEPHDAIVAALCGWSGLSPKEHERDAGLIISVDGGQIEKPKQARERARRIRAAAAEIENVVSSMGWQETTALTGGILFSRHTPQQRPHGQQPLSRNAILGFARALRDGAMAAERSADSALSIHYTDHENANLRRNAIAIQLAEIYVPIAKREPPKGGANGPFQDLLREVYAALGQEKVNLSGPLRAVHEFRKNRKS